MGRHSYRQFPPPGDVGVGQSTVLWASRPASSAGGLPIDSPVGVMAAPHMANTSIDSPVGVVEDLTDSPVGVAVVPIDSPVGVEGSREDGSREGAPAAKWPWKLASKHVHFMRKDGGSHFLCWRGQKAKPVDHMDGGDDIMAALTGGRPACKRCLRALPSGIREEVLRLSSAAGL